MRITPSIGSIRDRHRLESDGYVTAGVIARELRCLAMDVEAAIRPVEVVRDEQTRSSTAYYQMPAGREVIAIRQQQQRRMNLYPRGEFLADVEYLEWSGRWGSRQNIFPKPRRQWLPEARCRVKGASVTISHPALNTPRKFRLDAIGLKIVMVTPRQIRD